MENVFGLLLRGLFYTWWIIVPVLLFLLIQTYRRRTWMTEQNYVLLRVSVPKENDKAPVAAEQMFAALHGIRKDPKTRFFEGSEQEHVGFEIAASHGRIHFYAYVPEDQKSFVEGQVYAQYPKAEIAPADDYVPALGTPDESVFVAELKLLKKDVYPIKTFLNFEDVDPLSGITAVMADLGEREQLAIQILARPADDSWHKAGAAEISRLESGGGGGLFGGIGSFIGELFRAATGPTPEPGAKTPPPVIKVDEAISSGIRDKSAKLGYEVKIRILAIAPNEGSARSRLNSAIGAFKQYNTTILNGFTSSKTVSGAEKALPPYRNRAFIGKGMVLNIEELASIFHLPNTSVETPSISWTTSSKGEPPENLPLAEGESGLTVFAETNFRDHVASFGIKPDDRRRHVYAIGKTGMGKTNMLENMVISDMQSGRGLAVVDPHGDFIETVLSHIPENRVDDVIVFNPADREYPIAFNILEKVHRDAKPLVASGVVGVFEKIYGHSWGPRLEHILRNTILALLDYPDSTLLDVPRILADKKFREGVIPHIEDLVVREFWTNEFANYTDRQRVEAIAPIQNKVGQFLSSTTIRNIVGQKRTAVNLREAMDSGKILLIKLSKGELGEDASALLGAMLITKIQLAAMSRADIPESERRDFYLYVDEFQNFATQSFATILSEARKYGLNLAMANQYVAQMPEEVRDAVFGNVGTIISFRVGANDATWLVKELEPVFTETDIVNLDKFHIYLKLSVDGVTNAAFSAQTLPLPRQTTAFRDRAIAQSQKAYAVARDVVEASFTAAPQATDDEDRKRRYQSYLDRERLFAEQAVQAAPTPTTPAPQHEMREDPRSERGHDRTSQKKDTRHVSGKKKASERVSEGRKSSHSHEVSKPPTKTVKSVNDVPRKTSVSPESKVAPSSREKQPSARPASEKEQESGTAQERRADTPQNQPVSQELNEDVIIKF
jgi:hypothetical protein